MLRVVILALIGGLVFSVCPVAANVSPTIRFDDDRMAQGRDIGQDILLKPCDTIVVP